MTFYSGIDPKTKEGDRTIRRLLRLREGLDVIPRKTIDETLLLATWNIRDFDKPAYGDRLDEAIYYIAEIISHFDIVAIQEVYADLSGLKRVLRVLGPFWHYIVTDTASGSRGNKERITFVYDGRKIEFGGLAGEMVLPPVKLRNGKVAPAEQVWRTPFICGFYAGESRFMLASVHIQWGSSQRSPKNRQQEIHKVAQFLKKRSEDASAWSRNLILLGDFNIFSTRDSTFAELEKAGFVIPANLRYFTTNASKNKHYDQIAFRIQKDRLGWTDKAGAFDYYQYVFRDDDERLYVGDMGPAYKKKKNGSPRSRREKSNYYRSQWRTHQLSDHLPLWVELKIDYSNRSLQRLLEEESQCL